MRRYELVPAPFSHYVEDDPECFKGPGDEWLIVDVFFEAISSSHTQRPPR